MQAKGGNINTTFKIYQNDFFSVNISATDLRSRHHINTFSTLKYQPHAVNISVNDKNCTACSTYELVLTCPAPGQSSVPFVHESLVFSLDKIHVVEMS